MLAQPLLLFILSIFRRCSHSDIEHISNDKPIRVPCCAYSRCNLPHILYCRHSYPFPYGNGSILLAAEIEIDRSRQRCADNQQEGNGIDDWCAPVAHLEVEIDRQGRFGTGQEKGRVEVLEGHQEGHGGGADNGRAQELEGDVPDDLEAVGAQVESGLFQRSVELAQPGRHHQRHQSGDERKLAQHHQPESRSEQGHVNAPRRLEKHPQGVGKQQNRN